MGKKVYVASSWRNDIQPEVVLKLRDAGHEVYDFRQPHQTGPDRGRRGVWFHWSEISPDWQSWTAEEYRDALSTKTAEDGFNSDLDAIKWCDALVMVQPCGRSAALELGYAAGMGKETVILLREGEPELMFKVATLCCSMEEVVEAIG